MVRKATGLRNGARIGDRISLGILMAMVPAGLVDTVLADAGLKRAIYAAMFCHDRATPMTSCAVSPGGR